MPYIILWYIKSFWVRGELQFREWKFRAGCFFKKHLPDKEKGNIMAKIVLFDGTNFDMWKSRNADIAVDWTILDDGTMIPSGTDIYSAVSFKDAHIHVEFREPLDSERKEDQFHDGNSGIYIHGSYEVQIIDSYGEAANKDNPIGAIYEMYQPLSNASRPVGEWQNYDIYFRAPRFNERDEMTECARVTVILNGVCVQNNVNLHHPTPGCMNKVAGKEGPLMLQAYRFDPVKFRNIWIDTL